MSNLLSLDEMIRYSTLENEVGKELADKIESELDWRDAEIKNMEEQWTASEEEYDECIEKLEKELRELKEEKIEDVRKELKSAKDKLKRRDAKILRLVESLKEYGQSGDDFEEALEEITL